MQIIEKLKNIFKKKTGIWIGTSDRQKEELVNELIDSLSNLEHDVKLLINQVGNISAYCDKCDGTKLGFCLKCSNTGIVQKNRLKDWPWQ